MRAMPGPLKTFLDTSQVRWWGDAFTITLADGATKHRWTSADASFTVGGFTYATAGANGPAIRRGSYEQGCRLTIDTMDVTLSGGAFTIGGKTLPQLAAAGYFDFSRLQIDHYCGADLSSAIGLGGISGFFEGPVAGIDLQGTSVVLRAKSELETLNFMLPKFPLQPQCGNAVYDSTCGLNKATFTSTGTASGSPTRSVIATASAALTSHAAGYYELGVLTFTSGANSGLRRAVKTWASNTFTVQLPFPVAPAAGDAMSAYPGCHRDKADCGAAKFNNLAQFRGFTHIPAQESGA